MKLVGILTGIALSLLINAGRIEVRIGKGVQKLMVENYGNLKTVTHISKKLNKSKEE